MLKWEQSITFNIFFRNIKNLKPCLVWCIYYLAVCMYYSCYLSECIYYVAVSIYYLHALIWMHLLLSCKHLLLSWIHLLLRCLPVSSWNRFKTGRCACFIFILSLMGEWGNRACKVWAGQEQLILPHIYYLGDGQDNICGCHQGSQLAGNLVTDNPW